MPRLAANLTMLFGDAPFLDRFGRAAAAGFKGVEYLFPYEYDAGLLKARLDEHGLVQVLHNLPAGRWADGERGIACLPDRIAEFEAGVRTAIDYASTLRCPRVNCLAGIRPPDVDARAARDTFIKNLTFAAAELGAVGIELLVEPINTRDVPGFFLSGTSQALEIMDAVGSGNLFLQYDAYHMQIMEGDLAATLGRVLPRVAHVQVADVPGRHEPGTGTIDYAEFLGVIDRAGYQGWVGCEYTPATTTEAGLDWARRYLS